MPHPQFLCRVAVLGALTALPVVALAAPATTTTTLSLSAASAASSQAVTLSAAVSDPSGAVHHGTVLFCEATHVQVCTAVSANLLGKAQLTPAGTASLKLRFGAGAHSLVASFVANAADAGSLSSPQPLTATSTAVNPTPTITSLSAYPTIGTSYQFSAEVLAPSSANAPTGSVNFQAFGGNTTTLLGNVPLTPVPSTATQPSFAPPSTAAAAITMAIGDFNEDGIPDLIQGSVFGGGSMFSLTTGVGDGTFAPPVNLTTLCPTNNCYAALAADFNGDGHLDLAVFKQDIDPTYSYVVDLAYGNGDGTFTLGASTPLSLPNLFFTPGVYMGDFNGDGREDVLVFAEVFNNTFEEEATVLLAQPDGTFKAMPSLTLSYLVNTNSFVVQDVNNDGLTDVVSVANAGTLGPTLDVVEYRSNGDGTFTTQLTPVPAYASASAFNQGTRLLATDLRGTGTADLVLLNGNYTWGAALLNDGQGNYSPQANFLAGNSIHSVPGYAVAMDLNKDGKTDVLFANVADGTSNGCAAADYALLSNGDGTFSPIAATQLPNPGSCSAQATSAPLFAVDLNADGMQDLVSNSGNYTLLNISGWGAASASLASPHPVNAPGGLLALTAVYQPSGSFAGSTSSPASVNGTHIATTTTLSSPTSLVYNRPLTLTATVAPTNANGYSIKGDQVQFSVSTGTGVTATGFSQSVTVSGGVATATFTGLPVGQYYVSAYFEGDANFLFSTSATIPLQVTVPSPGDPELAGTYTFHFTGTLPSGAGFIPGIAGAGWFQADGAGNITAGEEDINTAIGTETATSVTGSFALAANGTGTLTLTNTQGVTLNFGVIAGPTTTTYPPGGGGPITTTNQLSLIGLSNEGAVLTGSAVTQPTGPSTFTLSGNYLLRALGDTGCSNGCSAHPNGQVSLVGTLTGSGQTATGLAVENAGGAVAVDNATTFTFSPPDANGRFTATHTNSFGYPDQPQHYVGYWLSASELYLLSIDPHASTTMLSGTLTLQQ